MGARDSFDDDVHPVGTPEFDETDPRHDVSDPSLSLGPVNAGGAQQIAPVAPFAVRGGGGGVLFADDAGKALKGATEEEKKAGLAACKRAYEAMIQGATIALAADLKDLPNDLKWSRPPKFNKVGIKKAVDKYKATMADALAAYRINQLVWA